MVDTALLGTERRTFDATLLPPELRSVGPVISSEQTLLQTAALSVNYLRAGSEPLSIPLPEMPVCEPETQAYASEEALQILTTILEEPRINRRLLQRWCAKCQENGWILPPDRLVNWFKRRKRGELDLIHADFEAVMGNRGRWLSRINPDWSLENNGSLQEDWYEAKGKVRELTLYKLRLTQPDEARALLEESWPQETPTSRKSFLNALIHNLSQADEAFLKKVRTELLSVKNPKPIHLEQLQIVNELLLSIPGGALFEEIVDQLRQYFSERTGFLDRLLNKRMKNLALPTEYDDFFNPEKMKSLGFYDLIGDSDAKQIHHWFTRLLLNLHPKSWSTLTENPDLHPVSYFIEQARNGQERETVIKILSRMVGKFKRAEWVHELIPHKSLIIDWVELLALLPQPEREAMMQQHPDIMINYGNCQFLTDRSAPGWSLSFSQFIWRMMLESWIKQPYLDKQQEQFFRDLTAVINPEIDAKAEILLTQTASELQQQAARMHLLHPLRNWLAIRQKLENL